MVRMKFWGFVLIVGLCRCSSSTDKVSDVPAITIDPDQPKMTVGETARCFTNDRLVVLRGAMLNRIDRIMDWGDRFVVFDRGGQQTVIFDTTGNCIARIKRLGKGPGEYIQVGSCAIDPTRGELVLYADQPGKLLWFDRNVKFLREKRISECFFEFVYAGGYLYAVNCGDGMEMAEMTITRINSAGEKIEQLPYLLSDLPSASGERWLFTNGTTVWLSRPFDYTVYMLNDDTGEFEPRYKLDLGRAILPEERIRRIGENGLSRIREDGFAFHVTNVGCVGNYLFLSGIDRMGLGYMIDMKSDSVRKLGIVPLFGASNCGVGGYTLLENQNRRIVRQIPATALEYWSEELKNKGERNAVLDSVLAVNAEGMNPVLLFQEVK